MTTLIQRSFSGGEIGPPIYARVDTQKYQSGARAIRNNVVMRHGGTESRAGMALVGETLNSTSKVRLLPFIFNSSQAYILELGETYIRFIQDGGFILESPVTLVASSFNVTTTNPGVFTKNSHGFSNGDRIQLSVVTSFSVPSTGPEGPVYTVASATTNTFALTGLDLTGGVLNGTVFSFYRIYTIQTPYLSADLFQLKYTQSADVLTLAHPNYAPRELARISDTSWTLTALTFAPLTPAPTSIVIGSGTGTGTNTWAVTAIDKDTSEESLPAVSATVTNSGAAGTPLTLSWTAAANAGSYNVYRFNNGVFGFIGVAGSTGFTDVGVTADTTDTPPQTRNPFTSGGTGASSDGSGYNPSAVNYFQQRLCFGNTNHATTKVWCSRTGQFKNFTTHTPIQDDDTVSFSLASRQVNEVRHLLELGKPLLFTSAGEWAINGDGAGSLTPTGINAKQYSYNGSAHLAPLVVGGNAIYVQARGSSVRDLSYEFQSDSYKGNDLTIFAPHLFQGLTLVDWTYQQIPHSIVWAVRDDGTLVALTYVREQDIWGWHRHDTDGFIESVCAIPEGNEDFLYVVTARNNGRYVERIETRLLTTSPDYVTISPDFTMAYHGIRDTNLLDSSLSFDGRNTNIALSMTLTGGSSWLLSEDLTLTASSAFFSDADIGNEIHLYNIGPIATSYHDVEYPLGTVLRCTIISVSSTSVVIVRADRTVPTNLRGFPTPAWAKAVDTLSGLSHLNGLAVGVFADGNVVSSPNNSSYPVLTVASGMLQLPMPFAVVHVGLSYFCDLETLNLDTVQGETLSDKKIMIQKVTLHVQDTRGVFIGGKPPADDSVDPLEGLYEPKLRDEENYDDSVALFTGTVPVLLESHWNSNGRVFIRQVDPIPMSILAVSPAGFVPLKGVG